MPQVLVERYGKPFDLAVVAHAVEWAYNRAQAEDEGFAARNLAQHVIWSPLTNLLQQGHQVMLELQMWQGTYDAQKTGEGP